MKLNLHHHSIRFSLLCTLLALSSTCLAGGLGIEAEVPPAPAVQTLQLQPVLPPSVRDFPGSAVTLTQPVNVLQPIPPASTRLPGLPN